MHFGDAAGKNISLKRFKASIPLLSQIIFYSLLHVPHAINTQSFTSTSAHSINKSILSFPIDNQDTNLHVAKVGDWHDSHLRNIIAMYKEKKY